MEGRTAQGTTTSRARSSSIPHVEKLATWLIGASLLALHGCVAAPKAAPELAEQLGQRIAVIEASHLALLHAYMDLRRARVDEFLQREWIPIFAEKYLNQPDIARMWERVNAGASARDRLQFFGEVSRAAQEEISRQRRELIGPLDTLEREIERRLREEYTQAQTINAAIAALLASTAKAVSERQALLRIAGVEESDLTRAMGSVESAMAALDKTSTASARFDEFRDKINSAVNKLKGLQQGGGT